MTGHRRLRIQLYADVLRAIHSTRRLGEDVTMYRIERIAGLTYSRLRLLLDELHTLGLLDGGLEVTDRGYAFLSDMSTKVVPVLQRYRLWDGHL